MCFCKCFHKVGNQRLITKSCINKNSNKFTSFFVAFQKKKKSEADLKKLESVVKLTEKITNSNLPTLESVYEKRMETKIAKILKDSTYPAQKQIELLPNGSRFRAFKGNSRLVKSFYPHAVKHLNKTRGNLVSIYIVKTVNVFIIKMLC